MLHLARAHQAAARCLARHRAGRSYVEGEIERMYNPRTRETGLYMHTCPECRLVAQHDTAALVAQQQLS